MKKINLFLVGTLFCAIGFTSCLEGGNTESVSAVGVLDYSYATPVMKTLYGNFYGPELTSMIASGQLEIGGCYYFQCTIDYDLPENSQQMLQTNGYYTASIYPVAEAEKYYPNPYLTDTSAVLPNELPVYDILYLYDDYPFGYAENYLFITHFVNHVKDLDVYWDMSYSDGDNMVTEESDKRQYNLFIRATASDTGDDSKATTEYPYFNAYYLKSFLENAAWMEKNRLGSSYNSASTFAIKFNYVSEIDDDSKITWKSKSIDMGISLFVQE